MRSEQPLADASAFIVPNPVKHPGTRLGFGDSLLRKSVSFGGGSDSTAEPLMARDLNGLFLFRP
jgi:hypothetical protein